MCLVVKKRFASRKEALAYKPKVASEDITVYKILDFINKSPYRRFQYEKGFEYYQFGDKFGKRYNEYFKTIRIELGLHAWTSKAIAMNHRYYSKDKIVEMVIPKGSRYYLGMSGDIVSDRLIWY